jgi:hypothetical protein
MIDRMFAAVVLVNHLEQSHLYASYVSKTVLRQIENIRSTHFAFNHSLSRRWHVLICRWHNAEISEIKLHRSIRPEGLINFSNVVNILDYHIVLKTMSSVIPCC